MSKNYFIIPIFVSHEGCPHQCVFCNQNKISGSNGNMNSREVTGIIEDHLKTIGNRGATIEVSFFGGTFTAINEAKQKEFLKVALDYKNKGYISKIRLSTRPDAINRYILDYLKEFKVDIIELGVQSLDDKILKLAGRGHTVKDVIEASKLIKEYGFTLGHQIMPGLPGSNFKSDVETAKKSIEVKPDLCRIYPALVIKDTPMEEMYKRGDYKPYDLHEAVEISSEILSLYRENKINVIRVGLQPTEDINEDKEVIAGPFHPAFRELVEGFIIIKKIKDRTDKAKDIIIEINNKDISKLFAYKKVYFNQFLNSRDGKVFVKVNNKIKKGKIKLSIIEKQESFKI